MTVPVHIPPTPFREAVARLASATVLSHVAVVHHDRYGTEVRPLQPWASFTPREAALWNVLAGLADLSHHLEAALRDLDERDTTALLGTFEAIGATGRPVAVHGKGVAS